jgi:hypothetical protein
VRLDRRTAALGVAAAGAVTAAVVVTVTNHASGASPQRRDVTTYITAVNDVQNRMGKPLTRVFTAYRDFTGHGSSAANPAPELAEAARTLHTLRARLAALEAPPEARKLRRLLLDLVGRQAQVTQEVQGLATFTPRFGRALAVAKRANTALGAALRSIPVPSAHSVHGTKRQVLAAERQYRAAARRSAGAQADAIDAYDAEIGRVLHRLAQLDPPEVLAPSYAAQVEALRAVRASGVKLAEGLRRPDRTTVPTLGRRFVLSSRIAQSTAAQKAQIAAIERYNARARAISSSASLVQQEEQRLQHELP